MEKEKEITLIATGEFGSMSSEDIELNQEKISRTFPGTTDVWHGVDGSQETAYSLFAKENSPRPKYSHHMELGCGKELGSDEFTTSIQKMKDKLFRVLKSHPELNITIVANEKIVNAILDVLETSVQTRKATAGDLISLSFDLLVPAVAA